MTWKPQEDARWFGAEIRLVGCRWSCFKVTTPEDVSILRGMPLKKFAVSQEQINIRVTHFPSPRAGSHAVTSGMESGDRRH